MARFTRVFPGNVSLGDTEAACRVSQQDHTANLVALKPALFKKSDGTRTKVNVADFELEPNGDVLNIIVDLRLIDVSTIAGAANAAALSGTHTKVFECRAHINDVVADVEVYGRRS